MAWLHGVPASFNRGSSLKERMDDMSDLTLIHLIVALNIVVQLMLIRRLKFPPGGRRKYYVFAIAIPLLVLLSMQLLVAGGLIHGHVADQTPVEQFVTSAASILLLAGPCLVTLAAILDKNRSGWLTRARNDE
jgi:hypothetical protein